MFTIVLNGLKYINKICKNDEKEGIAAPAMATDSIVPINQPKRIFIEWKESIIDQNLGHPGAKVMESAPLSCIKWTSPVQKTLSNVKQVFKGSPPQVLK